MDMDEETFRAGLKKLTEKRSKLAKRLSHIPNAETIAALEESINDEKNGKFKSYDNLYDFWKDLGIDRNEFRKAMVSDDEDEVK